MTVIDLHSGRILCYHTDIVYIVNQGASHFGLGSFYPLPLLCKPCAKIGDRECLHKKLLV
jgi:hypothetical protein